MDYQVVHSSTGRLRIRIPRLAWDYEFTQKLNGFVGQLAFVTMVRINPAASSLVVMYEPTRVLAVLLQEQIAACIDQARPLSLRLEDRALRLEDRDVEEPAEEPELEPEVNRWQDLGMPCLSLGIALLAAPLELPVVVVTAAIAGAALPWFMRAADSLVNHRQPNIDLLDSLWMTMQTVQGQYAAPALKTCLVEVRRALRGTTADGRHQEGSQILAWFAQEYGVKRSGKQQQVAALELQAGDRLQLGVGDWIPVDGWIVQGAALVDESSLMVSRPVMCGEGQAVYAGSRILEGDLEVVAERTGGYTRIGIVAQHLQDPPVHDTQLGINQAEFLRAIIFPTIAFGGAMFALTGSIGAAISPFQLDFGSGIPISVHSTLLLALTEAARHGIYIRSARVLEQLAQLDGVVFAQPGLFNSGEAHTQAIWQECAEVITQLQRQGIAVYWVTPDRAEVAQQRARVLGIPTDQVWTAATAEQAIALVEALQHQGKTIGHVGVEDGQSVPGSVAVALAEAGTAPPETADVVLLDQDLQGLLHALTIAKRAIEVVYENTAIIVAPNLLVQIGGGMILGMHPVINVITNNSSAFVSEFIHGNKPLFDQPLCLTSQRRSRQVPRQLQDGAAPFVSPATEALLQPS